MNGKVFLLGSLHLTLTEWLLWRTVACSQQNFRLQGCEPSSRHRLYQAQLFVKILSILSLWRALLPGLTGSRSRYLSGNIIIHQSLT